ncbi:MAG: hypothetical protein JNK27_00645 [Chitinophagaceae bacterium]|nr:hypothetical protein [Chitinophagaceae bacterium]
MKYIFIIRYTACNMGFAAMPADEYILIFLFAISSSPSRRNSIPRTSAIPARYPQAMSLSRFEIG